jgi:hypothetical protein
MASAPQLESANTLYAWLYKNSRTLVKRKRNKLPLTPRLEILAHANGSSYDVEVRFFVEISRYIPIMLLPKQHVEELACLIESNVRSRGFATVRPVLPGSSMLEFRDFVWNSKIQKIE